MPLREQLKEFCSRCLGGRKTDQVLEKQRTYIGKLQCSLVPSHLPSDFSLVERR